mmetsp:Transcript_34648/g.99885  ORF Transcript_34648/g.99885 Transcript_34648/m.99885 type:complete len:200 (+) Transcript_34648:449-1048(+)
MPPISPGAASPEPSLARGGEEDELPFRDRAPRRIVLRSWRASSSSCLWSARAACSSSASASLLLRQLSPLLRWGKLSAETSAVICEITSTEAPPSAADPSSPGSSSCGEGDKSKLPLLSAQSSFAASPHLRRLPPSSSSQCPHSLRKPSSGEDFSEHAPDPAELPSQLGGPCAARAGVRRSAGKPLGVLGAVEYDAPCR